MTGLDIFCGSAASTLSDVFAVAHPLGRGVLQAWGGGGLADMVQPLEQQGIESQMTPEERAAAQAKRAQQAAAPSGRPSVPGSAPQIPGSRPSAQGAPQAPSAQSVAPRGMSGWAKAGIGAGIVAALLIVWRAIARPRVAA